MIFVRGLVNVRGLRGAATLAVVLLLTGCESADAGGMPDVVGKQLDVALKDLKAAGIDGDVDLEGGGVLGVIDKSNWQVCAQSPAPGDTVSGKPQLTVDRSCEGAAGTESTPASSSSSAPPPSSAEPSPGATLTAESSAELASVLAEGDSCAATIADFAAAHKGETIAFDGNIAALNKHGNATTRYDILIGAGDYSETSSSGPAFQFRDVSPVNDLHFTDASAGDTLDVGENLRFVARVDHYESTSCLFLLVPVSTATR